tara:strand:+ start:273 stop:476 length:204 start_codon:yes stop_codon:yes gene_type:complete
MEIPHSAWLELWGYGHTGEQVLADLDITGRIAIVTGGYSGIGLETTRALAARAATVMCGSPRWISQS